MDKKPTAYIFGAGSTGRRLLPRVESDYEVLGFLDNNSILFNNNPNKEGADSGNYPVYDPDKLLECDFDVIVIGSLPGLEPITEQLLSLGVDTRSIDRSYVEVFVKSRILFLERLGEMFARRKMSGSVAEGGVFQGEFARDINRIFPEKIFYLFDTYEGFTEKDTGEDAAKGHSEFSSGHLNITSMELVKSKLPYPERCVFRKGYFPDTAEGISDSFCFVNLDFDLYNPTLAGLEFFYPKMVPGGVILIHDYFNDGYKGVVQAVSDYSAKIEGGLRLLPIGDDYSIAVMC